MFNERLTTTSLETTYVNFTSNGKTCSSIRREYSTKFTTDEMFYYFDGSDKSVYYANTWSNTAYKTITITSKLSEVTNGDELLAYLQANATKQ